MSLLSRWRKKYTLEGEKTQFATMEEENRALEFENAELKTERDMLKEAAPISPRTKSKSQRKIHVYRVTS